MSKVTPGRTLGSERVVAQRLALERAKRGWTYEGVARRMAAEGCPIQVSALHKVEKGDPPRRVTLDEAIAMANVFETPLEDFVMPMSMVGHRRARELARELATRPAEVQAALLSYVRTLVEYLQIAKSDPDLQKYVSDHQRAMEPPHLSPVALDDVGLATGKYYLPMVEEEVAKTLNRFSRLAHEFSEGADS